MTAMVFLKSVADISLFFMLLGPAAVHYSARPLMCVITAAVICVSQVLSFLVSRKKDKLRMIPYILPVFCILLPGRCIAWAVLCGLIFAYEIFTGASRRYMADDSAQKTIFKITLGLTAFMLLLLLIAGARPVSYTIVILSALVGAACSILLLRSLRHEPEVYCSASFQAVNMAVMAAVAALAALLSSAPVLNGILTVLRTVYLGIAYAFLFLLNIVLRAMIWLYHRIEALFGGNITPPAEQEVPQISMDTAADLFPEVEYKGTPVWLNIIFITIGVLIVLLVLILIFRKLAGTGAAALKAAGIASEYSAAPDREVKKRFSGQVQGVRKQYRKYLGMVEKAGIPIGPEDTSEDICEKAPQALRAEAARELRQLYIDARYNGTADRAAADRAKELVRELKSAVAAGSQNDEL